MAIEYAPAVPHDGISPRHPIIWGAHGGCVKDSARPINELAKYLEESTF